MRESASSILVSVLTIRWPLGSRALIAPGILQAMVSVDERIWTSWREQAVEEAEWRVRMRMDSPTAPEVVIEAVRRWMDGAQDGEWEAALIPDGVLVSVAEAEDFPALLASLTGALDKDGIAGALSLWEQPNVPLLPRHAPLLMATLTVKGQRFRKQPRSYRWDPDPASHAEVIETCTRWCRSNAAEGAVSLEAGTIGPILATPDESLVKPLTELFAAKAQSQLTAFRNGEFRVASVIPYSGRVLLLAGHVEPNADWWPAPLGEIRNLLRAHADVLVYARVQRGWDFSRARFGGRLGRDWPAREPHQPRGTGFTPSAFDDLLAPDAFGMQLLGPGYRDRADPGGGYEQDELPAGRMWVEHSDRDAWFAAPFLEPPGTRDKPEVPAILRDARQALAPILYEPGALTRFGFQDIADG